MQLEILWWLVPPVVVTLVAIVWVTLVARAGARETDRQQAVARLERALRKEHPTLRRETEARVRDRSTGIAVRPSRGE